MTAPDSSSPSHRLTVSPSHLREAHAHIAAHGRALALPSLHDVTSAQECLDRVAQEAARLDTLDPSRSRWVLGTSVRVEGWREPRWPTLAELDRASPARPACLRSFDHHCVFANSAAMALAGIDESAPDPSGGVICRDRDGRRTGILLESAANRVWQATPEPTPAERDEHVRAALQDFARHGFVEVHDLLSPPWLGPLLARLHDRHELTMHVGLYPPLDGLESQHASAPRWSRPGLTLMGAKIFVDGTLNSRTAWMLAPYRDPLPGLETGKPLMTVARIADAATRCAALGLSLAAHAIGDAAVRATLDALSSTSPLRLCVSASLPPRIEHCELIDAADVPRFAELGVVASIQPCHLLYDVEVLTRQLPHRLGRVLPLRELVESGLEPGRTLLFGSDAPIVRPHPQDSIAAAVHRARIDGSPGGAPTPPIAPAQALDESTAWKCFSRPSPAPCS